MRSMMIVNNFNKNEICILFVVLIPVIKALRLVAAILGAVKSLSHNYEGYAPSRTGTIRYLRR
jgi:hypothetical protein